VVPPPQIAKTLPSICVEYIPGVFLYLSSCYKNQKPSTPIELIILYLRPGWQRSKTSELPSFFNSPPFLLMSISSQPPPFSVPTKAFILATSLDFFLPDLRPFPKTTLFYHIPPPRSFLPQVYGPLGSMLTPSLPSYLGSGSVNFDVQNRLPQLVTATLGTHFLLIWHNRCASISLSAEYLVFSGCFLPHPENEIQKPCSSFFMGGEWLH